MPDPRIWPIPNVEDTHRTVTNASTLIRSARGGRVDCEFVNDSDYDIWLARGNAAVVGDGIYLVAKGGSYTIGLHNLWLGAVNAIHNEGEQVDANVTISEGYKL